MMKWNDFQTSSKHLIILIPIFFLFMFINAGIYLPIHNSCIDSQKENFTISYFGSLQYLQTVAFTIGYGHITPMCHLGKAYTFIFAYVTIPLVFYILLILGRKILDLILFLETKIFKDPLKLTRMATILAVDFFIFIIFLLIPAGIITQIEPCMSYGDVLWYVFATITTIGFGDVIAAAGYDHGDECEKDYVEYDFYHQENFFWVSKMGFLIVSLSFMVASLILKYETILENFYSPLERRFGNKQLLDNEYSVNSVEEIVMDNPTRP